MHINAVANSGMLYYVMLQLYLRNKIYNIIFKIKCKLYTVSGGHPTPTPTPPIKNFGYASRRISQLSPRSFTPPGL